MLKAKTAKILIQKTPLIPYKKPIFSTKKSKYIIKIGFIMYVIIEIQINIAFTRLIISCFTKNSRPNHFNIMDQILRFLTNSQDKSIIFKGKLALHQVKYINSD